MRALRRAPRGRRTAAMLAAGLVAACLAEPVAAAQFVFANLDSRGAGLTDRTRVEPVGGNRGGTLGKQRRRALREAGSILGAALVSEVPIVVGVTFQPLPCSADGAVLGGALSAFVFRGFPGAELPRHWYHSALADSIAGRDLAPGEIDIFMIINSQIDQGCLPGVSFYYGLDNREDLAQVDFLTVVLHEFSHGLGFGNFIDERDGRLFAGRPDVYSRYTFDLGMDKNWVRMTAAERRRSATNGRRLVWSGPSVTAAAPDVLDDGQLEVRAEGPVPFGAWEARPASFGPQIGEGSPVEAEVVLADDGAGEPSDACEPIGNDLSGAIALVVRGTCAFTVKVANAEAAGAAAVLVANNVRSGLINMGGEDPGISIPAVLIAKHAGERLAGALDLGEVRASIALVSELPAGTNGGLVRLYAPPRLELGSSVSHWDQTATPNLLMEHAINADLESASTLDLTLQLFEDVGWELAPGARAAGARSAGRGVSE